MVSRLSSPAGQHLHLLAAEADQSSELAGPAYKLYACVQHVHARKLDARMHARTYMYMHFYAQSLSSDACSLVHACACMQDLVGLHARAYAYTCMALSPAPGRAERLRAPALN